MTDPIFNFLRSQVHCIWNAGVEMQRIALTVKVIDRFSQRPGLTPDDPVLVPPQTGFAPSVENPIQEVQCQLYARTHIDGTGYHYEWIASDRVRV